MANGGTIFLDEIGELPLSLQPKLLRVLQQKEVYRIGARNPIKLNVRIICATNRDLKSEIENHRFRSDLFYRLNTGRICIPPLTERKDDILPLAEMFLKKFAHEKRKDFKIINKQAVNILLEYDWPGNVRELKNAIERVTLLYNDIEIKPVHLNFLNIDKIDTIINDKDLFLLEMPEDGYDLKEINKAVIRKVLNMFDGNKTKAAEYLNVARSTVYNNSKE